MTSFRFRFYHPTTLTLLSGLAIIVVATLALTSMAQDQSGHSVALVSKSLRDEMRIRDDGLTLIPCATAQAAVVTEPRVLGPLVVSFGQVKNNPNPPRDFAHLWSELQRVAGQCAIDAPVREVRIDVMNADVESIVWIIQQADDLANTPQGLGDTVQAEIQTWATSPTPTAWSAAISEANRLRDKVLQELSATNTSEISLGSSAALWPEAKRARPAMTIVLRFPFVDTSGA